MCWSFISIIFSLSLILFTSSFANVLSLVAYCAITFGCHVNVLLHNYVCTCPLICTPTGYKCYSGVHAARLTYPYSEFIQICASAANCWAWPSSGEGEWERKRVCIKRKGGCVGWKGRGGYARGLGRGGMWGVGEGNCVMGRGLKRI